MANFLQFKSFAAFVTAIKMDSFVLRVRFSFPPLKCQELTYYFPYYICGYMYKYIVLMSLSLRHSSVLVKLRNPGKVARCPNNLVQLLMMPDPYPWQDDW